MQNITKSDTPSKHLLVGDIFVKLRRGGPLYQLAVSKVESVPFGSLPTVAKSFSPRYWVGEVFYVTTATVSAGYSASKFENRARMFTNAVFISSLVAHDRGLYPLREFFNRTLRELLTVVFQLLGRVCEGNRAAEGALASAAADVALLLTDASLVYDSLAK